MQFTRSTHAGPAFAKVPWLITCSKVQFARRIQLCLHNTCVLYFGVYILCAIIIVFAINNRILPLNFKRLLELWMYRRQCRRLCGVKCSYIPYVYVISIINQNFIFPNFDYYVQCQSTWTYSHSTQTHTHSLIQPYTTRPFTHIHILSNNGSCLSDKLRP